MLLLRVTAGKQIGMHHLLLSHIHLLQDNLSARGLCRTDTRTHLRSVELERKREKEMSVRSIPCPCVRATTCCQSPIVRYFQSRVNVERTKNLRTEDRSVQNGEPVNGNFGLTARHTQDLSVASECPGLA